MSNQKTLKQQINLLTDKIRQLQQKLQSTSHENKKALLETKNKLQFQENRANEYQEKYKAIMQYKNQEETVFELDKKLRQKQDEIIKLINSEHEKSQEIKHLYEEIESLKSQNSILNEDLNQIKEAALSAIMDKDTTISQLTYKIQQFNDLQSINNLKSAIIDLEERYRELQQKNQETKIQFGTIIQEKQIEINEIEEKLNQTKQKYDDRIIKLEEHIMEYEKEIEELSLSKDHQENLQEKYYIMEQKLRKYEKKLNEKDEESERERLKYEQKLQKWNEQKQNFKNYQEEIREYKIKIKQSEKDINGKKKDIEQYREKIDKSNIEYNRKINQLQNEKRIISENLTIRVQQIEKLKAEIEQRKNAVEPTLHRQKSNHSMSPQKQKDEQSAIVEKLKKQNKDLEDINESLAKKLEQQTKELQEARQKLLHARGSDSSNSEVNKLRLQIEDLTSYLKKVQNDMLMKKITHAEDENFWSIKEKRYKEQFENLNKRFKKQNSELLERIDRLKKLIPKDKKTDYYQSGFK